MKTINVSSKKEIVRALLGISLSVVISISLLLSSSSELFAVEAQAPERTEGEVVKAKSRSLDQMAADVSLPVPVLKPDLLPFRPAMDEDEYKAHKEGGSYSPSLRAVDSDAPALAAPATLKNVNCTGILQNGWVPPDTHGAVGHNHYIQVVNSEIRGYLKNDLLGDVGGAPCAPALISNTLNAFMGYFTQALFDPRVAYDPQWKRFIVTAVAFPENASTQYHFIAISKNSNPVTGGWWIYKVDMNFGGEFYDYPQLGFDADGLILTANLFNPGYVGSRVTFISKSRAYNGLGITSVHWSGGGLNFTTIAPPIVRDLSNETWLVAAGGNNSILRVSRWNNVGHISGNFLGFVDVPVAAYTVPPSATQPGGGTVDTLDARFVNASTQVGKFLYNVHAPNVGGLAGVTRYKIDVGAGTAQAITFFSSGNSSDFNASIAVNDSLSEYITFSRVDTATFAQVRFAGKQNADAGFSLGTSFQSTAALNHFRWGDYSAITIDPSSTSQAWGVNEFSQANGNWGSHVFKIGIP